MPCDLSEFGLTEMLRCSLGLRKAAAGAGNFEEAAERISHFFYDEFRDARTGERQLVLARIYKTHAYGGLDVTQRAFADRLLGGATKGPDLRCLCLIATVGLEVAWNNRRRSRGHQVIPLPSREIVEQAPMIAQLVRDFGLDPGAVVGPLGDQPLTDHHGRTYGVFHVEEALGSPYIPAQEEFVAKYGVKSVVGFGGALRSGNIFAGILFSRAHVTRAAADRFRNLALDVKAALFDFSEDETFGAGAGGEGRA